MARKMSTRPPAPPAVVPAPTPGDSESPPLEVATLALEIPRAAADVDLKASTVIAQLMDDNAVLREQIAEMASTMARLRRQVLEASEDDLVRLALVIAERVVMRELSTSPDLVVGWARDAIDALAAKDEVVIAVAKDDPNAPAPAAWDRIGIEHEVVLDGQLEPGAIEVRTAQGIVAIGPEARLTAVATALGIVQP